MSSVVRWSKSAPCPICGGTQIDPKGQGRRCHGYLSSDQKVARCAREEHAGSLPPDDNGLFPHWMQGACQCGETHDGSIKNLGEKKSPKPPRSQAKPQIVATYDYHDEAGTLLFQVVRFDPKDFRQRRPDGQGGWIWGLGDTRRVLYRLPDTLEAIAQEKTIFLVEGEKDADAIIRAGGVATCNPMGAGKWNDDYSALLAGATIHLIQDKDDAGKRHCDAVQASLEAAGCTVTVREAREGKDAADHLAAGGTLENLVSLGAKIRVTRMDEVQSEHLDWLWYPYLVADAINFISGDPGCGKSFVCQAITASLSRGDKFFNSNGAKPCGARNVLYLYAEGSLTKAILPRLDLIGYDPARVWASSGRGVDPNDYLSLDRKDLFEGLLRSVNPKVVIFDPIESFIGNCNPNAADEVRPRLDYLADCCERYHFTAIGIRFDRKAGADNAKHRSAGSIAWMAAGRSFLGCVADPERPNINSEVENATFGLLTQIKVNDAAAGDTLRYSIRSTPTPGDPHPTGRFSWDGISAQTAEDLISTKKRNQTETKTTLEHAKEWIVARLRQGAARSDDLIREATDQGICSRRTLFTAKKELGIHAKKVGFNDGWEWEIVEVDLPSEYQSTDR